MMSDDLTEIKVATARIEEQLKGFMSALTLRHEDHDARLAKLEQAQSWVVKGIVGSAMTAVAAATGLTKKIGL